MAYRGEVGIAKKAGHPSRFEIQSIKRAGWLIGSASFVAGGRSDTKERLWGLINRGRHTDTFRGYRRLGVADKETEKQRLEARGKDI